MNLENELKKFKFDLMRKMPFYGDILMRIDFVENNSISTAATNGLVIMYNRRYISNLNPGQRNYALMHELLHILFMHCKRNPDKNQKLWNVACDMVVNSTLDKLAYSMKREGILLDRPPNIICEKISDSDIVENIYAKLEAVNRNQEEKGKNIVVIPTKGGNVEIKPPDDLIPEADEVDAILGKVDSGGNDNAIDDFQSVERCIGDFIKESAAKNRGTMGSFFVPAEFYELGKSKVLPWKKLLKDYLIEEISEDASYATPERKYLHMDLILPGHCLSDSVIGEVWAFVDSSGSIEKKQMEEFLTQLYRILKEFHCKLNICYWDTQVTDVYKNICKESDILKCLPSHSGGTDINCVYEWIKQNKIRPEIMLILTDGYFGRVYDETILRGYRKNTIMVLASDIRITGDMEKIGKIARL